MASRTEPAAAPSPNLDQPGIDGLWVKERGGT